ncbi:Hemolysin_III family protein [Hexamita inflata]|uniref:Hemolysin III family protein n=1 Tax=Hexamita inflata TaxID=28002 RepID=A0AA86PGM9_9EUKA|nr:Hemolysin III family protein [Hexamita inflata]
MSYKLVKDEELPKDFKEQHFVQSDSDDSDLDPEFDTGFASSRDPDFSKMTPTELSTWTKQHNYKPEAVTNEIFNTTSHLVGGLLFLFGIVVCLSSKHCKGAAAIFSFIVYGISTEMMLFGSAMHHGVGLHWGISIKMYRALRLVDHEGIFFVIAGTFTPFALIVAGGPLGIAITVYMYFIMFCGIMMKFILRHTVNQNIFNSIYLLMGWSAVLLFKPIVDNLGWGGMGLIIATGVSYTVGVIIFSLEKPNPFKGVFCSHEIWHVFVVLGVLFSFLCHYLYTLPKSK